MSASVLAVFKFIFSVVSGGFAFRSFVETNHTTTAAKVASSLIFAFSLLLVIPVWKDLVEIVSPSDKVSDVEKTFLDYCVKDHNADSCREYLTLYPDSKMNGLVKDELAKLESHDDKLLKQKQPELEQQQAQKAIAKAQAAKQAAEAKAAKIALENKRLKHQQELQLAQAEQQKNDAIQQQAEQEENARKMVKQGENYVKRGKYKTACSLFKKAAAHNADAQVYMTAKQCKF
jgi:chemotaxis protein histidine kinase CheA